VEQVERSAPSVEEAVEAALAELGASEQEAVVEVVQEPRAGFLGVGSQPAVVRVRRRSSAGELSPDDLEEQADIAADFLEELLSKMGVSADIEIEGEAGTTYVEILGNGPDDEDMGLLIGRHGSTLDALQDLARLVVIHRTGVRCRIVVDVEDYRKRQRSRLESRAREVAQRVARSKREEALDPMTPFDRKIVHDVVAQMPGVESASRGEEPERRVVIRPTT
jgi:spoIIIJ-associated protein